MNPPSESPAVLQHALEFRGRRLLKVIVLAADVLLLGLTTVIVVGSVAQEKPELLGIAGLPCLVMLAFLAGLTNRTFSVLRIDRTGVALSRFLGSRRIAWTEVSAVFHWVIVQHGVAAEPYAALRGSDGKTLLLLKSTYDPGMFQALAESARAAGVRVQEGRP